MPYYPKKIVSHIADQVSLILAVEMITFNYDQVRLNCQKRCSQSLLHQMNLLYQPFTMMTNDDYRALLYFSRRNQSIRTITNFSPTVFSTNSRWTALGMNPGIRVGK